MTIGKALELVHRANAKVERAKRVGNVHDDIETMDGLITLVEALQASLRDSATASIARR